MSRIGNIQQTSAVTTSDKQQEKKQPTLKQRAPWMESIASKPLEAPVVQAAAKPETAPTVNPYVGKTADQVIDEGQFNATQYWQIQDEAIRQGQRNPYTMEEIVSRVRTQDPLYETAEQKAKREKTEKAQRAITGVSDLISNVANLAYTAQGAVPVVVDNYTPLNERQKTIQDKRDALKRQYDSMLAGAQQGEIAYQRSLQAAREKAAMEQAYKERELALKNAYETGKIKTKAEYDRALKELEQDRLDARTKYTTEARAKEGAANRANARTVASIRSSATGDKNKDKYTYAYGEGGEEFKIPDNKLKGISARMYSAMQDYVKSHPEERRELEDIQMQIGKGGDVSSKTINTVMRRLSDFPELYDELRKMIAEPDSSSDNNKPDFFGSGTSNKPNFF